MKLSPHCYRETLVAVIRDLGHAYLALCDRKDWTVCVTTIDAAYETLVKACDARLLPRVRKETGISTDSALRTIASLVRIADEAHKEFEKLEDSPGATPQDLEAFTTRVSQRVLLTLAVGCNSFLCEDNVWKIRLRGDSSIN